MINQNNNGALHQKWRSLPPGRRMVIAGGIAGALVAALIAVSAVSLWWIFFGAASCL